MCCLRMIFSGVEDNYQASWKKQRNPVAHSVQFHQTWRVERTGRRREYHFDGFSRCVWSCHLFHFLHHVVQVPLSKVVRLPAAQTAPFALYFEAKHSSLQNFGITGTNAPKAAGLKFVEDTAVTNELEDMASGGQHIMH